MSQPLEKNLTLTQTSVLNAVKSFFAGEKYQPSVDVDWLEIAKESISQAVALSTLNGFDYKIIPDDVKNGWQKYATNALFANAKIHSHHAYLDELMQKADIKYVILKGGASSYYYPDPLMRSMGDVDFLVAKSDVEKASKCLIEQGFVCVEENHACHVVFVKEDKHFELHFAPAGMPDGLAGERISKYLEDIFDNGERVSVSGFEFVKPSAFHHGLTILMHTYHHMLSEGVGLRHLCDWATFINSFDGESFELVFKEKLSDVGLWTFAVILSNVARKYLGSPEKEWMGEINEELCFAVMDDVFSGGNFGNKDASREMQGLAISTRGKDGVKEKSKCSQVFVSLNQLGKTRYPRMAKIPVIKYFCFVPLGFRYCFRVLTGKRKRLKVAGSMQNAEYRKSIYKQFQLYEIGDKNDN